MIPLTIGTWNVHKLVDSDWSDIQQRRTALVGIDFGKCKIAIAVVGEADLAEVGKFKGILTGYLFLRGRKRKQRPGTGEIKTKILPSKPTWEIKKKWCRLHISSGRSVQQEHIVGMLPGLPKGTSYNLMTL